MAKKEIAPIRCEPDLVRDRWHRYKIGDEPVFRSVTTVIGKMDKPALIHWSSRLIATTVRDLVLSLETADEAQVDDVHRKLTNVEFLKSIPDEQKGARGDIGTKFHIIAERFGRHEEVNLTAFEPEIQYRARGLLKLMQLTKPVIRWIEFPAIHRSEVPEERWAGTGDNLWEVDFGDGLGHCMTLLDYKTSESLYIKEGRDKNIYPIEHALQLWGLSSCQTIYDTNRMVEVPMPEIKRHAVVDIKSNSIRVWTWTMHELYGKVFRGLSALHALEALSFEPKGILIHEGELN